MVERKYRCLAIGDFNTSTFNGYLNNDEQLPLVEVIETPYGQVTQVLLAKDHGGWEKHPDFVVAWTRSSIPAKSLVYSSTSKSMVSKDTGSPWSKRLKGSWPSIA